MLVARKSKNFNVFPTQNVKIAIRWLSPKNALFNGKIVFCGWKTQV